MTNSTQRDFVIRTTSPAWLAPLAHAYRRRQSLELIDDAQIGIDPIHDTLLDMGKKAKLSHREWIAAPIALGIGLSGAYLLIMAILDPELFSKIAIALTTGGLLVAGGG